LSRRYPYYDPIDTLPASGQAWWKQHSDDAALEELTASSGN
jgi:lysine 2,3-aminomutase